MPFKLTDTAIRAAKPREKRYQLADGEGLYVEVAPTGGKWWRIKYRFGGKEKRLSLGVYPAVGLKEARNRAAEIKDMLRRGLDPGEERKAAKAEAVAVEIVKGQTFEAVAREWYEKKRAALTPGHQKKILLRLENQLFPYLGNVHLADLEAADFLAAIQKAEARGAIETAHRLAQLCGQVTRYARISGIVKHDAAAGLTEALAPVHPQACAWASDYVAELTQFPGAAHDDQVDATTQALRDMDRRRSLNINPAILRQPMRPYPGIQGGTGFYGLRRPNMFF